MAHKADLELGLVGNATFGVLIDSIGRIVWMCLPRYDGDPIFCALLKGTEGSPHDGAFTIELVDFARAEQTYRPHTAILETRLYDRRGACVEIVDYAPRFERYGRMFRPPMLVRRVRPVTGHPRIAIRMRPLYDYGGFVPERTRGTNHLRHLIPNASLRLTTNAPIAYIEGEIPFVLDEIVTLVLGPDEPVTESLSQLGADFLAATERHWRDWSRGLAVPFEWQEEVIRAAITLQLCTFEETGAIVAAITTSIPESPNSGRNWDYRNCWLRDAYFVIHALNRLGKTSLLERYLRYITNLAAALGEDELQPVYGVATERELKERIVETLPGYRGMGPVRVGNAAYFQTQNDSYGAIILASAHVFYDQRLSRMNDVDLFAQLERHGEKAIEVFEKPDAGLWELRTQQAVHTFSAVMCWAATSRLGRIATQLGLHPRAAYWQERARALHATIMAHAWNEAMQSFVTRFEGDFVDASLLLLAELQFVPPDDPKFISTVERIGRDLWYENFLLRYAVPDDFGKPEVAFTVCSFWYVNALASIGRMEEARRLFERLLACRNRLGLLSEDIDPKSGELWGNFPQTYSMVGLILCAIRLSKSWDDAF